MSAAGPGRAGVYLLFFASGVAGLIYQVVWVRAFGNAFGNTVYSAALVTALFMLGLGLGSYLGGWLADRRFRQSPGTLLRLYGAFELGVGLLAAALALGLPLFGAVSAGISSYVRGPDGWFTLSVGSQAARYLLAAALLLPITTLMGGTLTVLIRHLVRESTREAGYTIGVLYGLNTAGAAVGAIAVDFALVPSVGLRATQLLAVALNLGVGVVALRWAKALDVGAPPAASAPEAPASAADPAGRRLVIFTGVAMLLSGVGAMGFEMLWLRYLSSALGARRSTFSLLVGVMLVGIWLGSFAGGFVDRRWRRPALAYMAAQCGFVLAAIAGFWLFDPPPPDALALLVDHPTPGLGRSLAELWAPLAVILQLVGVPAVLMGCAFPLGNAIVQRSAATVGRRAGALYLANTVGAVAGSLLAGFVLLPALGSQRSLLVLGAVSLAAIAPLYLVAAPASRPTRAAFAVGALVGALALAGWASLPPSFLARRAYGPLQGSERLLTWREGIGETLVVTETHAGSRRLYTNGHSMSTTLYSSQRYMRAFAHLPLLHQDAPRHALVICFGVGNTVNAVSRHPSIEGIDVVDLSRDILEHAAWFARWNEDVLKDPRVSVFVNDGRQHLRMTDARYDLITLEPPPIDHAGVASLYSREFYALARERLVDGGFVTQWVPAYQAPAAVPALVRAFTEVFPDAIMLSGWQAELILVGRRGAPLIFDPDAVERRLTERPAVAADLKALDLGSLTELVGTFVGGPAALARATEGAAALTDDLPVLEYVPLAPDTPIPPALFAVDEVEVWCPACGPDRLPSLRAYLGSLGALYATTRFLLTGNGREAADLGAINADPAQIQRAYRGSRYLQRLFAPRPPFVPAGR